MSSRFASLLLSAATISFAAAGWSQEKKLETLNVSYVSVSASRAPLWIAKDLGLYEKYGLDVRLVVIRGTQLPITALVSGEIQVIAAPATGSMVAAARGLPVVVIGTFGPSTFRLVSQPSITSISELRGKTIGISQPTNTDDFTVRRLLLKFGLVPGKDVNILGTGLTESNKRMALMLQGGRFEATLATPDTIYDLESRGGKVRELADTVELGIHTSISDLSTTRDFIKNHRKKLQAFLMAFSEAIWIGKTNKDVALKIFRKYMRADDPKRLEMMYKNYMVSQIPAKPYPMEEAIQSDIENLSTLVPEFKGKKASDFMDPSVLKEIESQGFFTRLYR
jgi:ABC-type nitrate/sulfonate/bicarbonate transport system substrate-binding protein